jgi:hypothetical protein
LEDLLPKDNENVPLPEWATEPDAAASAPFAPDQMVRCDKCLRANPPTRVNCLYCGAILPHDEATATLQQPALRRLEKWERGYNNILLQAPANLTDAGLAEAATLLRLTHEDLKSILATAMPLPLARASSRAEALLVQDRLRDLGINSDIMPDTDAGTDVAEVVRVRSADINDDGIEVYQTPETPFIQLPWADFVLVVSGRLITRRVELVEKKAKRAENSILDMNEFVTDEIVVDMYLREQAVPYRVAANNFDFSCLGANKGLIVADNIAKLIRLILEKAPQVIYDDSFNSVRKILELVWPSEQEHQSSGWRRERPGKVSLGSATELSNQKQFLWYSRLRNFLQTRTAAQMMTQPATSERLDGVS